MACSSWFEYLEDAGVTETQGGSEANREVNSVFMEDAEPHFRFVMDTLEPVKRDALRAVAADKLPAAGDVQPVVQKGYVVEREGAYAAFSEQFARYVREPPA